MSGGFGYCALLPVETKFVCRCPIGSGVKVAKRLLAILWLSGADNT